MKKKTTIIYIIIIAVLIIPLARAGNIGISPASVSFKQVLRGGYSERHIFVSSSSTDILYVDVSPYGEISSWLNTSIKNFSVTKDGPYSLKLMITPPLDTPNGNYSGFLRFKTTNTANPLEGQAVGTIISALDLSIDVEVIDTEIIQCSVSSFSVDSVEKGDDIVFNLDISNSGNVRLNPNIKIDIWDRDQTSIVKSQEFKGKEILPSTGSIIPVRVKSSDLDTRQYFAQVSAVDCYSSMLLTFDILEEGALKADGVLLDINAKKDSYVGDNIQIVARFQNTGQKEVLAQFKGKVTSGNKIIQILESEKFNVPISEVNRFNFYFTPKNPGRYTVSGNVYYSNKKTFESSAIINVISSGIKLGSFLLPIIYILLIFLIIFLFYKINKQRKKYQNKLRRFR